MISRRSTEYLLVTWEQSTQDHVFDFQVARYIARYRMKIPENSNSLHLRVSYDADLPFYFRYGSKGEIPAGYTVHYILITGSTWKGDVDLLSVEVDPGPFKCMDLFPTGRSITGNCAMDGKWRHEARNQVLTKDLELVLNIKKD